MTGPGGPTVAQMLQEARALGVDRLDAQRLLAGALGCSRASLIAHDDRRVPAHEAERVQAQLAQRARGVPLAYLTGEREFYGLRLHITPAVLVPRPETEGLVAWALELLEVTRALHPAPQVLDLGTGSGAIALAIKSQCPRAQVHAIERSTDAMACAQGNGQKLGLQVHWHSGDWFDALPPALRGADFDLIVGNPPYIGADDPHLPALHAEPAQALTPGPDALAALAHLARHVREHLRPGGAALLEHGHAQGAAVRNLLTQGQLQRVQTRRDLAGHERCTGGHAPGPTGAGAAALPYP